MSARLFAVLILLLASPLAAAAPGASPTMLPAGDRFVYAELALGQPDLTTLDLSGELWAYRYDVRGKVYDADDIGEAYLFQNKYAGEPSGDAFVLEVEKAVREALTRTLSGSFADATITDVTASLDRSSLVAPAGNPYDPPIHVSVTATVARTREAVGLGDLSDDAVDAAFASGARLVADFTLTAETGYEIQYDLAATPGTRWEGGQGVSSDGERLRVVVDNGAGLAPSVEASARLLDPSVTPPTEEDVRSTLEIAMGDIATGASGIPIHVNVTSEVRVLDVSRRFPDALPPKVILPFVNADGLRSLRATGAIGAADVRSADEALLAEVRDDVERAFGPGATVTGGLVSGDLARAATKPYGTDEPLRFLAQSSTSYAVPGANAEDLDLALRIGGTANVELTLFAANGRATDFVIRPPAIAEFSQAEGGTVTVDGRSANFAVPAGSAAFPATVHMRGRDVPEFDQADARIDVLVDITDIEAGVGRAISGDLGTMLVDVTVTGNLKVIELPPELSGAVPDGLDLRYISSDAIRLLVERGHISEEDLAKLEESLAKQVREKIGAALGGEVPVTSGLDRASLAAALVSTPISKDEPVVFRATMSIAKPLAGGPAAPQAAIALYTKELPLTLPAINGLDTVYTIIAPRGLAIVGVTGEGTEQGTAPDGRDQIVVRPGQDSAQLSLSMAVTPAFVFAKFWPVVLLAVLLLVLIIGTPIALVTMKRRRKDAAKK